jgi:hypothetical protein
VYKPLSLDILSPHFLYQPFLLFPIQGYPPDSPSSQKCVLLFDVFSPPAKKATFSFMFFPVLVQHRNLKLGGFSDIFPIEKLRISLHVFFPCTSSMGVGIRCTYLLPPSFFLYKFQNDQAGRTFFQKCQECRQISSFRLLFFPTTINYRLFHVFCHLLPSPF